MSSFCPLCGAEIADDAKFCTSCGSAIQQGSKVEETVETVETVVENTAEQVETTPVYSSPITNDPVINAYSYNNNSEVPVQEGSKALAIIALILGILSLLCCCWFGIIGVVFSLASLVLGIISIAKKMPGKGIAIAAVICGALALILSIIIAASSAAMAEQLVNNPEFSDYLRQLEEYGVTVQ